MSEPAHGTSGGIELTGELIEQLTAEAEAGYDVEKLRTRRWPPETARAVRLANAESRLARIAEAHTPVADHLGGISGYCPECSLVHPCPTVVWATTDRSSLDPWDPSDDEETP